MQLFNAAVVQWNEASAPVVADMSDPTLDLAGFGDRTASDRAMMRSSVEAMDAAIAPGTIAEFAASVRAVDGTFSDRIDAIDAFVVALGASDRSGMDLAVERWEEAVARSESALTEFLEAARPYLSPEETLVWERHLGA